METKNKGDKRKLWLLLPVLVVPFLAFAFYKMEGGTEKVADAGGAARGINTELPGAVVKEDQPISKIGYYQRADRDSAKVGRLPANEESRDLAFRKAGDDPQAREINSRLEMLNREISRPVGDYKPSAAADKPAPSGMKNDVDRLEALMKTMQQDKGSDDPEMAQLASMMDKLIAVQNPELAKQLYRKSESDAVPDSLFKAIPAVIAGNQKARQGSVVELRLLDTVLLSGVKIPKGHALFGLASFSNQRLNLEIKNIRLGNQVIPVNLTVYDKRDAMAGINAPEALLSEAIGNGATDAMGSVGISGFDLTTQIAGAGIDAARSLLSKKIRRVKQSLKAGYPLLLRDNSKKLK
ncbi:conjugative transposon protein TraM [Pedobacter panaciterrae]|uniref:Conjugative transposon protein TraM n=1 Tax=Pedobacter panaciterrae TaxID=363849 RepID=A0ABU8NHK6_9SPHI